MTMTIAQLISSASSVKGYDPDNTFSKKKFGAIYAYNKVVRVKPNSSIMEVTMMIKAVSDRVLPAKEEEARPVAAHKVMVSIRGIDKEIVNSEQLIDKVRKEVTSFADEEKYPNNVVLEKALDPDSKIFENKTVLPQNNGTYAIINDNISADSIIRVWCSCSSYYWVFQYYNVTASVDIWGRKPTPYVHKTTRGYDAFMSRHPLRNPDKNPGVCKHILLLLALLMDSNTLSSAEGIVNSYRANIDRFNKVSRLSRTEYERLIGKYKSDHIRKLNQRKAENWMADLAVRQREGRRI